MKQLFKLISNSLKKWYYYQELKEISLLISGILTILGICNYGTAALQLALSQTGLTYLSFLMAAIVLGIVIKMYYRIIVIKYHEKDTNIGLFQQLHNNN